MQWRISPGGGIPRSWRSIPEAATVVRHRYDGGQIFGVIFQTAEHGGKAGAAADGDDLGTLGPAALIKGLVHGGSSFTPGSYPDDFPWPDSLFA